MDTAEAHLKALILQKKVDHAYFELLRAQVQGVSDAATNQETVNARADDERETIRNTAFGLRRELFAVRDELSRDIPPRIEAVVAAAATAYEQRLAGIEATLAQVQATFNVNAGREANVEQYLEQLHGERPAEGNVVMAGFQHLSAETADLRARLHQIEVFSAAAGAAAGPPARAPLGGSLLTSDMIVRLEQMDSKIVQLDGFYVAYNAMCARVNEHDSKINFHDAINQRIQQEISAMNITIEENSSNPVIAGPSSAAPGLQCGACDDHDDGLLVRGARVPGSGPGEAAAPGGCGGACCGEGSGAAAGKNDGCHCPHVTALMTEMAAVKAAMARRSSGDPWQEGYVPRPGAPPGMRPDATAFVPADRAADAAGTTLPLNLRRPLGGIANMERHLLFDDKLTLNDEYRYDGVKNGPAWKVKLENYFMGKAAVMQEILTWAEAETEAISEDAFVYALSLKMDDQKAMALNASLWGFLAGCVHGAGSTVFKRAEHLNGIEAWRRMVRQIDRGLPTQYETRRRELKAVVNRPIKSLEQVEEGIAAFENAHRAYQLVGGPAAPESEMKYDLLAVLPKEIREPLIWHSSEVQVSFAQFRDVVQSQTAKVLLSRGGPGLHVVAEQEPAAMAPAASDNGDGEMLAAVMRQLSNGGADSEEIIAVLNRWKGGKPNAAGIKRTDPKKDVTDRKCPNCGKVHPPGTRTCPSPQVPVEQRPCWTCGKTGHSNRDCPSRAAAAKSAGNSVRQLSLEDRVGQVCFAVTNEVDYEGFTKVTRGGRPRPRLAAPLAEFIKPAKFFPQSAHAGGGGARRTGGGPKPACAKPPGLSCALEDPAAECLDNCFSQCEHKSEEGALSCKQLVAGDMHAMTLAEFEKVLDEERERAEGLLRAEACRCDHGPCVTCPEVPDVLPWSLWRHRSPH